MDDVLSICFVRHVQFCVRITITALNASDLSRVHSTIQYAKGDAMILKLFLFYMMKVVIKVFNYENLIFLQK